MDDTERDGNGEEFEEQFEQMLIENGVLVHALAALLVVTVQSLRGERVPWGWWRDYVTLTKPRIMSLLLLTGAAGAFVGAGGVPPAGAFGHAVASLFGADPKSDMDADLMRMKSMIETGRAPHDAAQPV